LSIEGHSAEIVETSKSGVVLVRFNKAPQARA